MFQYCCSSYPPFQTPLPLNTPTPLLIFVHLETFHKSMIMCVGYTFPYQEIGLARPPVQ